MSLERAQAATWWQGREGRLYGHRQREVERRCVGGFIDYWNLAILNNCTQEDLILKTIPFFMQNTFY